MCLSMPQFSPGSKQKIVSHVHKMRILVTKKSVILFVNIALQNSI